MAALSAFISMMPQKTVPAAEAMGNPLRLLLTPGQASEYEQAATLIDGFACEAVLADKGYDSAVFGNTIQCMGADAVIPSKRNRLHPRTLDRHLYKARNLEERFFGATA